MLADAARAMPRSGIRNVMDAAWSQPGAVIGLHVGEPSFPTPSHILAGAQEALQRGDTRYTPNPGITSLREALASKVSTRNQIEATADNIVVTAGGMQAIHLALAATIDPGSEVLIPDPGWPNFEMAVLLARGVPVRYRLDPAEDFAPDLAAIGELVTSHTRAIILNTPANPLGTVLPAHRVAQIVEFAGRENLWLISDECYDALTFDTPHVSPGASGARHVLSCFSFSKTYAMTGMRVGYVVAERGVAAELAKLQEALIACVNSPAQHAALAALDGPQDVVTEMCMAYQERRDLVADALTELQRPFLLPHGAFYLWADVSGLTGGEPVLDWSLGLLRDRQVAVAPGSAFGHHGEGWVRISLATATADLLEGVRRLATYTVSQPV